MPGGDDREVLRRLDELDRKVERIARDHEQARAILESYVRKAKTMGALLKRVL